MSQTYTIDQALAIATQQHLAGRLAEAESIYRQILQIAPSHPTALHNLGEIAYRMGKYDIAIELASRAVAHMPLEATFRNTLAAALFAANRPDESYESCKVALQLNPNFSHAYGNLGNCLAERGELQGSIAAFERALQLDPENAVAHDGLGLSLLKTGQLQRGWREQEWRWQKPGFQARRHVGQPHWDGSDLAGKTILLYIEQGYGDLFHLCRYVPLLAARGATVILEAVGDIESLLRRLPGVHEVLIAGSVPTTEFDFVCPLLSVPLFYGTTLETIPAEVPYMSVAPDRAAAWADSLKGDGNFKVGLTWAGRSFPLNRATTLKALAPLGQIAGITFYSLQKEEAAREAQNPPAGMNVVDLAGRLTDFQETAAAIGAMDLIITIDTAVAHLAGALAKPVWTMLHSAPDWRWLEHREDSPWYPTMRLFRAQKRNDWPAVVQKVKGELAKLVQQCQSTLTV
jgi:tetratricopeptide (TPR) repeat protein